MSCILGNIVSPLLLPERPLAANRPSAIWEQSPLQQGTRRRPLLQGQRTRGPEAFCPFLNQLRAWEPWHSSSSAQCQALLHLALSRVARETCLDPGPPNTEAWRDEQPQRVTRGARGTLHSLSWLNQDQPVTAQQKVWTQRQG